MAEKLVTYIKLEDSKDEHARCVTPKNISLLEFMQEAGLILCFEPASYELVASDGALIRHVSELIQEERLVIRKRRVYGDNVDGLRLIAGSRFSQAISDWDRVEAAGQLLFMPQELFQLILKTSQRNSHSMTPYELANLIDQAGDSTYVFMDIEQSAKLLKCFDFEGENHQKNYKFYHVIGSRTVQFWRLARDDTFGGTIAHCYYGQSQCDASTFSKETLEETTIAILARLVQHSSMRSHDSYLLNHNVIPANLLRKVLLYIKMRPSIQS